MTIRSDLFSPEIFLFLTILLIVTAIVKFALARGIMRESKSTASIIAVCIGLLASYGLLKTGLSMKWTEALNFGPNFLVNGLPWIIIILSILIGLKWGLGIVLLIFGSTLFISGFFNLIYAKWFGIIVGIILSLTGLWLIIKRSRQRSFKKMNLRDREDYKIKRRENRRFRR
jgi:hypothetical protein